MLVQERFHVGSITELGIFRELWDLKSEVIHLDGLLFEGVDVEQLTVLG